MPYNKCLKLPTGDQKPQIEDRQTLQWPKWKQG